MTSGQISPDGFWRWDGQQWVPNQQPTAAGRMQPDAWVAPAVRPIDGPTLRRGAAATRVLLIASLTVFLVGAVSWAVNMYISVTAGRESDRLEARLFTDSTYNGDGYIAAGIRAADAELYSWMGAGITVLGAIAVVAVLTTRYGPKVR
jgi:hypothetical protein